MDEEVFDDDGEDIDDVPDAEEAEDEEVDVATTVKIVERRMVPRELRRTSDRITRMELNTVVQLRIGQLSAGGATTCRDIAGMTDVTEIAVREIAEGVTPIILERTYDDADGTKCVEHWEVRNMRLPM